MRKNASVFIVCTNSQGPCNKKQKEKQRPVRAPGSTRRRVTERTTDGGILNQRVDARRTMSASVVASARGGPRPSAPSRAAALLSLLDEPRAELRAHALSALSAIVDVEWSAVASSVATIEALYEDEGFGARLDAAMLASKVRMRGVKRRSKCAVG